MAGTAKFPTANILGTNLTLELQYSAALAFPTIIARIESGSIPKKIVTTSLSQKLVPRNILVLTPMRLQRKDVSLTPSTVAITPLTLTHE